MLDFDPAPLLRELGATRWAFTPGLEAHSRVWRVETPEGVGFLKRAPSMRAFQQETDALRVWAPALPAATAPRLLRTWPEERAFFMSEVAGAIPLPASPEAWGALGALLARLHALPCEPDDPLPLAEAYAQRAAAWSLGLEVPDALARRLRAPRPAPRVPCHRDVRPENAAWDGATLALIDWEHARPDAALADLAGAIARAPNTACEAALRAAYGPVDVHDLDAWAALGELATLAWAARRAPTG